jgi:deoxyribodipyrimidine photo-lyase
MKTKHLVKEPLDKKYTVMQPYFNAIKPLIEPSDNKQDFGFKPSGMGRTSISEKLAKGADPHKYYNSATTGSSADLRRQLLVREFFFQAPVDKSSSRRPKSSYKDSEARLKAWKAGETGYALIDAGMIQLAIEGWMPNRVRMLCASFLTKNLQVWWQLGESYFAKKLVDYDPHSNLGNWLWVSGEAFNTRLTDVLSPDLQLRRFDPKLEYVNSVLKTPYKTVGEVLKVQKPEWDYNETKQIYLKSL